MLLFPFAASNFENRVGTFQFLHIFFLTGISVASMYVFIIWMASFIFPSWGTANVCGLDIPFIFLITTESLAEQGLFEVAKQAGIHLPNILFPLPWIVGFLILFYQSTSLFGHIFAFVVGMIRI